MIMYLVKVQISSNNRQKLRLLFYSPVCLLACLLPSLLLLVVADAIFICTLMVMFGENSTNIKLAELKENEILIQFCVEETIFIVSQVS